MQDFTSTFGNNSVAEAAPVERATFIRKSTRCWPWQSSLSSALRRSSS
ncbi:MAG: hypothetical protein ABL952_14180 [Pyrinomonadaceae bacterium]